MDVSSSYGVLGPSPSPGTSTGTGNSARPGLNPGTHPALPVEAGAGSSASNPLVSETQNRFLTLLITQLKNQDPLNPLENAEITSQLAQLSTVNGITQLNNTLLALSGQVDMSQAMQATALIDKDVLIPGDKIAFGNGVATPFGVDLVSPAANVKVAVVDAAGKVIRQFDLGAQPVGVVSLEWDGTDDSGQQVPAGAYFTTVSATDEMGGSLAVGTLSYARVRAIAYTANGLQLDLGLAGQAGLYDIRKIL